MGDDPPVALACAACDVPRRLLCGDLVIASATLRFEPGFVLTGTDGLIISVGGERPAEPAFDIEMHAAVVAPGLIDLHNHGVGGSDSVLTYWLTPEFTTQRLPRHGTTGVVATVVWDEQDLETTYAVCDALSKRVGAEGHGAILLGIHSEGPCVATLGGLPEARSLNAWDAEQFDALLQRVGPSLRLMTLSPSVDAAAGYLRTRNLLARGVACPRVPALGHDKECKLPQVVGALRVAAEAGARLHVTHTFNVQALHHREPGLANVALVPVFPHTAEFAGAEPPTVEAIGDGCHVAPLALQLLLAARAPRDVAFVTDAIAEPLPGKEVAYAGSVAHVAADGCTVGVRQPGGGWLLCGSCTNLHASLCALVSVHGVPLPDAVEMLSCTPARIGRLQRGGNLAPGAPCDAILLDAPPELTLRQTLVGGRVVYDGADPAAGPWMNSLPSGRRTKRGRGNK